MERSWALGVPVGLTCSGVWDTMLGDTVGQAGPDYLVGSDSSQKIGSITKQNCMDKVSALMLDSKLLCSPGGAERPQLMGTEVQNTLVRLKYVRKAEP